MEQEPKEGSWWLTVTTLYHFYKPLGLFLSIYESQLVSKSMFEWLQAPISYSLTSYLGLENTSGKVTKTGFTVCGLLSKPSAAFFATQLR